MVWPVRHGILANSGGVVVTNENTLSLNGSTQALAVPDSADFFFDTDNFCWSGRFYFDVHKNYNGLMGQFQDASNRSLLFVNSSQQIGFFVQSGGTSRADYISTGVTISLSTWHHILVQRVGATLEMYLDGSAVSLTETTAFSTNSYPDYSTTFDIGRSYVGGALNYFNGSVCDCLVLSDSMSSPEITEIYNTGKAIQPWLLSTSIRDSFALALPLNTGVATGRDFEDYSGNENNPTLVGAPTITGDLIEIDNGLVYDTYDFDGSTQFISIADDPSIDMGTDDFAITGWFNCGSLSNVGSLVNKRENGGNAEGYVVEILTDGTVQAGIRPPVSGSAIKVPSSTGYNDNKWHFFVANYDRSGNMSIQVDLATPNTANISSIGNIDNSNPLYIGQNRLGNERYDGSFTSVQIYNRLLNASEAEILYNQNLPKQFDKLPTLITDDAVLALEMTSNDNSLTDLSGNGNDGTANGGVTSDGEEIDWDDT